MTDTIVRLKSGKMTFETRVDLDSAMKLKKGEKVDINDVIRDRAIYTDIAKGMRAGNAELSNTFGTTDFIKIVETMIKKGSIEITQEFRDEAIENRRKQIVEFLSKNAIDVRTNRPFTPDIINSAIKEAGVKIDSQAVEKQIPIIVDEIKKIIPIKISTKKIKIKIPSQLTGQTYGLVQEYKDKEEWLSDGSLEIIINIPVGIQMDFYDRLNKITHGSALTQEIKE